MFSFSKMLSQAFDFCGSCLFTVPAFHTPEMIRGLASITSALNCGRYVTAAADIPAGTLVHASLPYAFAAPPSIFGRSRRTHCHGCLVPLSAPSSSSGTSSNTSGKKPAKETKSKGGKSLLEMPGNSKKKNSDNSGFVAPCPNCHAAFCSAECRNRFLDFHQSTYECKASPLIADAMANKNAWFGSWFSLVCLVLARAQSENRPIEHFLVNDVAPMPSAAAVANTTPSPQPQGQPDNKREASTVSQTSTSDSKEKRRLVQFRDLPSFNVLDALARHPSVHDIDNLPSVQQRPQEHRRWIETLWGRHGAGFDLLSQPSWQDVCGLVCNTHMLDREDLSLFNSLYRTYTKCLSSEHKQIFPEVSEELFHRVCGAVKCNTFEYEDCNDNTVGTALLPAASYFNHACRPNLGVRKIGHIAAFYTLCPVRKGEDLTICYSSNNTLTTSQRRTALAKSFLFWCGCDTCEGRTSSEKLPRSEHCEACPIGWMRPLTPVEVQHRRLPVKDGTDLWER